MGVAADLAVALIPVLAEHARPHRAQPERPSLPLHEILGLRWARVSGAGLIKAANDGWGAPGGPEMARGPVIEGPEMEGPGAAEAARAVIDGGPAEKGEIVLNVGSPFPHSMDIALADPSEDATLVAQGYAALTALRGPTSDEDPALRRQLDDGLASVLTPLGLSA